MSGGIAALVEKGRRAQAQSPADFDWESGPRLPFWTPRAVAVWAISQFCHGERATIETVDALVPAVADPDARAFLATQRADEVRHLALYHAYVDRLGARADAAGALARAYGAARAHPLGPTATMLAFHVVLEGESLRIQRVADAWMPCPLFRAVSAAVARDEARHVAFGKLWLRGALAGLPLAQRLDLCRWLRGLWFEAAHEIAAAAGPLGALAAGLRRPETLRARWLGRMGDLEDAGLIAAGERPAFEAA